MLLKSFVLVSWVGRSTSICSVNYRQISCVWCIIFYHLLDCGSWVIRCIEIVTNKIYVHCPTRSSQSENCINRHSSRCNMGVSQLKLINRPGSDNKMEELFFRKWSRRLWCRRHLGGSWQGSHPLHQETSYEAYLGIFLAASTVEKFAIYPSMTHCDPHSIV